MKKADNTGEKPKRTRKKKEIAPEIPVIVTGNEAPVIPMDVPPFDDADNRAEFLADIEEPVKDETLTVVVMENKPEQPAEKMVHFKIAVTQDGIVGVENPVTDWLAVEFTATVKDNKPLDITYIAGYMANNLMRQIKLFKNRNKGFFLRFSIDNQLIDNFQTKSRGNFRMQTASDVAYSIANLLNATFNMQNDDSLLTGKIQNSAETNLFIDRIGLGAKAKLLPSDMLNSVVDVRRRGIKKKFYEAKKEALAAIV